MSKFIEVNPSNKMNIILHIKSMAKQYDYDDDFNYLYNMDEDQLLDEYKKLKLYLIGENNA